MYQDKGAGGIVRYWVIKGNRRENEPFEDWFKQGHVMTWRTAKPPKSWQTGDRLFFWKSSPDRVLVGLGILKEIYDGRDEYGDANFDVEYLTSLLENQPTIVELRNDPRINTASFLKAGVAGTVYPLSQEQGENLFRIVVEKNTPLRTIWEDINLGDPDQFFDDINQDEQEYSGTEGRKRLVTHLQTERDRTLIERKKKTGS
jgi:hypothetical protein